jgi:hypothetical protein
VSDYEVDTKRGWLTRGNHETEWIAGLDWPCVVGWTPGIDNYRILYTAGYATVPEDVQEATSQWVANLFWQTRENPAVYPDGPTSSVAFLLDHYRRHRV